MAIPHVAILHAWLYHPWLFHACFLNMSLNDDQYYTSGYYMHLASSYARAGHTQMDSVIRYITYKIQSITVKGARVENAEAT